MRTYTETGFKLYTSLYGMSRVPLSTEIDAPFPLPDGTEARNAWEVEDWILKTAEQIKSERQRIIIKNTTEKCHSEKPKIKE